jgi:hypothetical protein
MKIKFSPILLLFLFGCVQMNIYSDVDTTTNFKRFKTFAWLPHEHNHVHKEFQFDNDIVENNIIRNVNNELFARGFQLNNDDPDILLEYDIMTDKKVRQQQVAIQNNPNYYYRPRYNRRWNTYSSQNWAYNMNYRTINIPYVEGTLTIDIIEKQHNRLVWKSYAVGELTDIESFERELPKDIHKMFNRLPIKPLEKK